MLFKIMNWLLKRYAYNYEIEGGDRGFVLARSREEAIEKLVTEYGELYAVRERIERTDNNWYNRKGFLYLYPFDGRIRISGDVYITQEW